MNAPFLRQPTPLTPLLLGVILRYKNLVTIGRHLDVFMSNIPKVRRLVFRHIDEPVSV
jgi:hypothetical protein